MPENKPFPLNKEKLFHSMVEKSNIAMLSQFAENDQEFDLFCKIHHKDRWRTYWENEAGKKVNENFRFHSLPTIDCFDLLRGMYFYTQYIKLGATSTEAMGYLCKAADLGWFLALNVLCRKRLALLAKDAKENYQVPLILKYAKLAKLHWTPGFLLCSSIYRELAQYSPQTATLSKQECFLNALENLLMAEHLMPYSEAMINNAYFGKSLDEAMHGKFISWSHQLENLVASSDGILDTKTITEMYEKTKLEAEAIVAQYQSPSPKP